MKIILKTSITLVVAGLFFTGCETEEKINKISENIEKLTQRGHL